MFQNNTERQIELIAEEYADIIKENQEKYPLSEEEYKEHLERFRKAMEEEKQNETN